MNADVKELWINALRSGEYEQGEGALRVRLDDGSYGFCCLGVLCDIYREETGEGEWSLDRSFLGESEYLPTKVRLWAGLRDSNPVIKESDDFNSELADINDNGVDFETIADYIEKQL